MTTERFSITVRVEIDSGGRVVSAEPVEVKTPAQKLLAPEATQAARLWRFDPARRNEQPVASEALLKFDIERPH
jgi:outer membrane biosynthesis protein TonB